MGNAKFNSSFARAARRSAVEGLPGLWGASRGSQSNPPPRLCLTRASQREAAVPPAARSHRDHPPGPRLLAAALSLQSTEPTILAAATARPAAVLHRGLRLPERHRLLRYTPKQGMICRAALAGQPLRVGPHRASIATPSRADRPVKITSPAFSYPICMQHPGPSLRPAQCPSIAPAGWQQLPSPPPSTASLHRSTEDVQPLVHHFSIVPHVPAPIHRPPRQPKTCPSQTREPALLRQRAAAASAAGPEFLGPTPATPPAYQCMQIR